MVFGAGALIALLLGYFGFSAWRKKKHGAVSSAESEDSAVVRSAAKFEAAETVAPAATPTEEISVLGDFTGGSLTEESIDPVAEADVLMAYGRDRQAEEILLEGLKADSTRTAIYAKLLELYANRKDEDKFEAFASDLHGLTGGEGVEWARAVTLAQQMGISGGMFGAAAEPAEPAAVSVAPSEDALSVSATEMAPLEMPAAAPSETPATPEIDASAMDFDLDLGTTSMPAAAAAAEQAAAQPAAEETMALDFDFDLGTPAAAETPAPAPTSAPVAEAAPAGNEISFDLDLGSGPAAVESPAPAVAVEAPAVSAGALDFDLDLGSVEPPAPAPATAAPSLELPDISLDLEAPVPAAASAPELSLPGAGGADNPEAATKLELAQAYEEMGDREGARELLNEVLAEGSPAQQEQARARLDQLSV